MKNIVIFGATSAIAVETARIYAQEAASFVLIGRNQAKLESVEKDLKTRGAVSVKTLISDLSVSADHASLMPQVNAAMPKVDLALIAYGSLGEQKSAEASVEVMTKELETNFVSVVSLLTYMANYFSAKKSGTIAVVSSVAGDRGRQSNYVYGAAKGALTLVLQGLRNRLFSDGVQVLTIKPGFVDTPMTADIKKNFLFVKPKLVAEQIVIAVKKKKDVVYVPWFWRYIMLIIKIIPEFIFKRLSL